MKLYYLKLSIQLVLISELIGCISISSLVIVSVPIRKSAILKAVLSHDRKILPVHLFRSLPKKTIQQYPMKPNSVEVDIYLAIFGRSLQHQGFVTHRGEAVTKKTGKS